MHISLVMPFSQCQCFDPHQQLHLFGMINAGRAAGMAPKKHVRVRFKVACNIGVVIGLTDGSDGLECIISEGDAGHWELSGCQNFGTPGSQNTSAAPSMTPFRDPEQIFFSPATSGDSQFHKLFFILVASTISFSFKNSQSTLPNY